ncbi:LysR family transcriptional regulator [Lampropedia puyangensis]|uniref:LysR family transcriptional regulator n=1 Tax=Lampropedia puyangensis TaxID=1330072 RepID=A0A4S8FAD3_9BURK|nr:LysR family transcriptional regulator [Lampropedia puyangensis]THU04548.1 LysR family transcriptional regulator [Lampropedia puyangensis]
MRINYNIDDIRAFCYATRTRQFQKAADLLFISPSALSRRIANIESAIGGPVFHRSTRHVRLTTLGATFYDQVSPLLAQMDDCFSQAMRIAQGDEGNLVFACIATVAYSTLPQILPQFHATHPSVLVSVRDGIATSIMNLVEQGHAEFGISTQMAFGSAIVAEKITSYGFNIVCAKTHPWLNQRKKVTWQELHTQKVVGLNPLSSTRLQIDAELRSAGIELPWTIEVDQLSSILGLVQNEGYLAVLPTLFDAKRHGLRSVGVDGPTIERDLFFAKRRDSTLSPQSQLLAELLCKAIRHA